MGSTAFRLSLSACFASGRPEQAEFAVLRVQDPKRKYKKCGGSEIDFSWAEGLSSPQFGVVEIIFDWDYLRW